MRLLTERPGWKALETHYQKMGRVHLRDLFADDPLRGERLRAEGVGITLDYSKNRITDETIRLLVALAEECGLREHIERNEAYVEVRRNDEGCSATQQMDFLRSRQE